MVDNAKKRFTGFAPLCTLLSLIFLGSCSLDNWQNDLESFVETGLTTAYISSSRHVQSGAGDDLLHGVPVTVTASIANPKNLDLAYALSCDTSLVEGGATPAIAVGEKNANGSMTIAFEFTPTEAAEHGDVVFTVALSAPALNKTFKDGTISLHCDSPPDSVGTIKAGLLSDGRPAVGFTLPEGYGNADVVSVDITYANGSTGDSRKVSQSASQTGADLATVTNPPILDSNSGQFVRYFVPEDGIAYNPYTFTVSCVDAAGKVTASPATASITGKEVYIAYDANGGTGTVGATYGFNQGTTTIAGAKSLSKEHCAFMAWNSSADGSGTRYAPGDEYAYTSENLILFAQWLPLGSVDVTVTIAEPKYGSLAFSEATLSAQKGKTITVAATGSLATGGTDWAWYLDGAAISGQTSSTLTLPTSDISVGSHSVSCAATSGGVRYSGGFALSVAAPFAVSFDGNGNTAGSPPSARAFTSGESVTLPTVAGTSFARSGYSFLGWAASANATTAPYGDGASIGPLTASVTLYAVWKNEKPSPVKDLTAMPGNYDRKAILTWTDPPETDVVSIKITYTDTSTHTVSVSPGAQTCAIKNLTNEFTYTFTVIAIDSGGLESDPRDSPACTPKEH
jgi:hypothetical protein